MSAEPPCPHLVGRVPLTSMLADRTSEPGALLLPCGDAHLLMRALARANRLAAIDGELTAELPDAPDFDRLDPNSHATAAALLALTLLLLALSCGVVGQAMAW